MSVNETPRPPISQSVLSQVTIVQIIIGVTFALILVEFWRIHLEALFYNKLGIDRSSAFQSFIVAITLTIILLLIINYVNAPANDLIVGVQPSENITSETQSLLSGTQPGVVAAVECRCRDCGDTYNCSGKRKTSRCVSCIRSRRSKRRLNN